MEDTFQLSTLEEYGQYLIKRRRDNSRLKDACELLEISNSNISTVIGDKSLSEREYVEVIALRRKEGYSESVGGGNKAAEDETDKLYAKNPWKFAEEFLQNADDCHYESIPEIEIKVDEVSSSIEFIYNEEGFSRDDIWAIAAFKQSTKAGDVVDDRELEEGIFYREKTGRKGIGFKAVFSLRAENVLVHIRSNGFSFKLDNKIGRIIPVWEDDPQRMDGRTHVIVELVRPEFDLKEIYLEFRALFCIDKCDEIFAKSPFLFMHRMRSIHVVRISKEGEEEFSTKYIENIENTSYERPFEIDNRKEILAGISHNGCFYEEQFQEGIIVAKDSIGSYVEVPVVRLTRMVSDKIAYRNYSIMAPVLTSKIDINWKTGSLFRTFPMSLHGFNMPFAIDAPYELNPDRSGIQYRDEKQETVNASDWNTEVTNAIFSENGVFEAFLLWLRTVDGIRMDKYIKSESIILFEDRNNSDGHGHAWVPKIDISELSHTFPLFRLFANHEAYVSFNDAEIVNKDLFNWPCVKSFFSLMLGEDYEGCVLSDIYVGSSLFEVKHIVESGFVEAMNAYLDEVEENLQLESDEMITFVNTLLYPYLKENFDLISKTDPEAFKNLCIYFSRLQDGNEIRIIRENYSKDIKWFHSENKNLTSINRFRIFESSPINMNIIKHIVDDTFGSRELRIYFSENIINKNEKSYRTWDKIRDFLHAAYHFGYYTENLRLSGLGKYVLNEELDDEFNVFRTSGVAEQIDNDDVLMLADYFDNIDKMVQELKRMGLKPAREYFDEIGNYLMFRDDTLEVLKSQISFTEVLDDIKSVKQLYKKDINATFDMIYACNEEVLLFFLDEKNKLFFTDSYTAICDSIQEENAYWERTDVAAIEILIRACAGATNTISKKETRTIKIKIDDVLCHHLEYCIAKIVSKNMIGLVSIENDGSFIKIPEEEINPLIDLLKPYDLQREVHYFKGIISKYGSEKLYLKDGKGGHVYLHCDEDGNYKQALGECLDKSFDTEALKYIDEMEQQYQDVKERVIVPLFNKTGHDLSRTYDEIERRFDIYSSQQIINILSWFRYTGYTNALGNGNINNEKEIEDDYKNDPWKFVYEFIQNVDDCRFIEEKPELSISVDKDNNSIVFKYNETGFTLEDVKALTKFGDSNKTGSLEDFDIEDGVFDKEKTGRKGRGFKSVFALPGQGIVVHICSNGFSFKFVKRLGSIIPIWEDILDAPETGTRITVEGFDPQFTKKLLANIQNMFGINDMSSFCSVCPILYLRKLNKVYVNNGEKKFSIDIEPVNKVYSGEIFRTNNSVTAGIVHDGKYQTSMWEQLKVSIDMNDEMIEFYAVRYWAMFFLGNVAKVASVFSPVLDLNTQIRFRTGALYRTLPLNENIVSVPISINAPFETNSGRSAVDDVKKNNNETIIFVFGNLLEGFFNNLRSVEDILIEEYIPRKTDVLFDNYKNIDSVDMQVLIRTLPILRTYSGDGYVSCKDAKVLPEECYKWKQPEILSSCFDSGKNKLVKECYANLKITRYMVDFRTKDFVSNLNEYLNALELEGETSITLLQDYIYPFINQNYEMIFKKYREEDNQSELSNMQIFVFKMADGIIVRESADDTMVWMKEVPEGYFSFGKYRSVDSGSLSKALQTYKWIKDLHEVISYTNAFSSERLESGSVKDWNQTEELIKTILYYGIKKQLKIPYLRNCALSEEFDSTENLFRIGFKETGNTDILSYLIAKEDLLRIGEVVGVSDNEGLQTLAETIRSMGLKASDAFFKDNGKGIYSLNSSTLALLEYYCYEKTMAESVLIAIDDAFHAKKQQQNANIQLHIPYEDIKNCHESIFAKIFEYEILSGDMQRTLADEFCRNASIYDNADYVEAYLRSLNVIGKAPDERCLTISLSEIIERGLGECAQICKLNNLKDLELTIVTDMEIADYPSKEIDQALKWLDDEDAVSVSYEYYTAELSRAFGSSKEDFVCFLFDDTKVIINAATASNSMLEFVQKRYRGKDTSFKNLVSIISEQNELKGAWKGTKKEYIEKLSKYRENTWKQREVLVPEYDKHINDANGKAINYVLPELLQNINDCNAGPGQDTRTLTVKINIEDGTMLLQYDEAGFDYTNVYSITAIGQSSKHDESEGEKGLGFKKAFALFDSVEIYSNDFCFSLSAEKTTVPRWIVEKEKKEINMIEGKTTMLFTVAQVHKKRLKDIAGKWKELMEGQYVGNEVSPLFLKNIDYIYVEGCDKHYSREIMMQDFLFKEVQILPFYKKLLEGNEVQDAYQEISRVKDILKTRRKCKEMADEEEREKYIDSLTFEVCIPRKIDKLNQGKGCFYSTLPTESLTHSTVFMNVPLELTTGRDGIVDDSDYNNSIMRILFKPYNEGCSTILNRLLESIADENRDIFILVFFSTELEKFIKVLSGNELVEVKMLHKALENTKIFRAYKTDEMVSLWDAYSVDRIISRYINEVPDTINDIAEWMQEHSDNAEGLELILPTKVEEYDEMEKFASVVESQEGYYPIQEDNRDFAMEYLMEEYGYIGGGESDE